MGRGGSPLISREGALKHTPVGKGGMLLILREGGPRKGGQSARERPIGSAAGAVTTRTNFIFLHMISWAHCRVDNLELLHLAARHKLRLEGKSLAGAECFAPIDPEWR